MFKTIRLRSILLATALSLTVSVGIVIAADPSDVADKSSAENDANLAAQQEAIAMRFRRFEGSLQQLSEYLRKTDPARAELLVRAIGKSKEGRVSDQFHSLTDLLKKDQLGDASDRQEQVIGEMKTLLELLMSEARRDEIDLEKKRIQNLIKDVTKLIGQQSDARSETERGGKNSELIDRQNKITDSTKNLVEKVQSQDAAKKASKNESKSDTEGDEKKDSKQDSDDTKEPNPSENPASPEKKQDSDKGTQDGKSSKSNGKNQSEKKDGSKKTDSDKPNPDDKPPQPDEKGSDDHPEKKSESDKPDKDDESQKGDSKNKDSKDSQDGKKPSSKPEEGKPKKGKPQKSNPQESQEQPSEPNQDQNDQQESGSEEEQDSKKPSEKTPGRDEMKRAMREMQRAIEELKKKNNKGASDKQDRAIAELLKAKEKLEEILLQKREEERELVLAQLETRFRAMLQQQEEIYKQTVSIDAVPVDNRNDGHRTHSANLSRDEEEIALQADKALMLLKEEGSSIAFPEAVEQIRDDMKTIARRLERVDVGEITQNIERDTIESLKEVIEAMQKEIEKMKDKKQPDQQGDRSKQQQQQQKDGLVKKIAEMKMLRSLQFRVNRRTKQLGRLVEGEQAVDPDIVSQLRQLSDRQAKVQRATYDMAIEKNQ